MKKFLYSLLVVGIILFCSILLKIIISTMIAVGWPPIEVFLIVISLLLIIGSWIGLDIIE